LVAQLFIFKLVYKFGGMLLKIYNKDIRKLSLSEIARKREFASDELTENSKGSANLEKIESEKKRILCLNKY